MIVAFIGRMGSGKSTMCSFLKNKGFENVNFKDSLIEELKDNFSDLLEYYSKLYEVDVNKLFFLKPEPIRRLLQNYGTDVRRKDNQDYWVDKWINKSYDYVDICIDDCRFINEYKAIKSRKGLIIKIERENTKISEHISEKEFEKLIPDYVIENNGKIIDAVSKLEEILKLS